MNIFYLHVSHRHVYGRFFTLETKPKHKYLAFKTLNITSLCTNRVRNNVVFSGGILKNDPTVIETPPYKICAKRRYPRDQSQVTFATQPNRGMDDESIMTVS